MLGIYRVAAQLVASRVVLSSTELYTNIIFVIYYYFYYIYDLIRTAFTRPL
jgi:hypothetical protein